jgi:hypothetical protein
LDLHCIVDHDRKQKVSRRNWNSFPRQDLKSAMKTKTVQQFEVQ